MAQRILIGTRILKTMAAQYDAVVNSLIRIMVVDDHELVRQTLCDRLGREMDFQVVATAGTAEEAIEKTLEHSPAIVLMDIDLAGVASLDATVRITSLRPRTRIIFVSAFAHDRFIDRALALQVHGYVTKRERLDVLIDAIRSVASGRRYYSEEIHSRFAEVDTESSAITGMLLPPPPERDDEGPPDLGESCLGTTDAFERSGCMEEFGGPIRPMDRFDSCRLKTRFSMITPRQRQILAFIADGRSKKQIADMLHVSIKTVESHCESLMTRLSVHDRVGLARYAIREGLINP